MKITIAIPTIAGRTHYLAKAIETCTAEPDPNLEILVSDNSEGDAEPLVRSVGDSRVRYIRPPCFLPMAAHWDFVLKNVTGESVTIIGDDDGVMPGAIAKVRAIHHEHGNVLIHHPLANYCWPDHPDQTSRNTLSFLHPPIAKAEWKSSAEYLNDALLGRARYYDGPMIYHNFVPVPLVRKIADGGSFFRRAIPDVYSALALAANSERFLACGTILTLAGQGARSNGALVVQGKSDASTFGAASVALHRPRFGSRSVSLLMLDSMLEVAERFDPELVEKVEFKTFFANALREARQLSGAGPKRRELLAILSGARQHGVVREVLSESVTSLIRKRFRTGATHQMTDLPPRLQFDASVGDIASATKALAAHLAAQPKKVAS